MIGGETTLMIRVHQFLPIPGRHHNFYIDHSMYFSYLIFLNGK